MLHTNKSVTRQMGLIPVTGYSFYQNLEGFY